MLYVTCTFDTKESNPMLAMSECINFFSYYITKSLTKYWMIQWLDEITEQQYVMAKKSQKVVKDRYKRLKSPKFTLNQENKSYPDYKKHKKPTILVVIGVVDASPKKIKQEMEGLSNLQIFKDPNDIICHTNINGRLLPHNFSTCTFLSSLFFKNNSFLQLSLFQAATFAINSLTVEHFHFPKEKIIAFCEHGRSYLAQYIGAQIQDIIICPMRQNRIKEVTEILLYLQLDLKISPISRQIESYEAANIEEVWAQLHWFLSMIGLDIGIEIAIFDSLIEVYKNMDFS
jgi:hypothetical protein